MSSGLGTTPYISLYIEDFDLTEAEALHVTLQQNAVQLDLTGDRIAVTADDNGSSLIVHLTQEETLAFKPLDVEIQVRWRDTDDEAYSTEVVAYRLTKVLYTEVI